MPVLPLARLVQAVEAGVPVDRHPLLEAACAAELAEQAAAATKAADKGAAAAVSATQGNKGATEMRLAAAAYT